VTDPVTRAQALTFARAMGRAGVPVIGFDGIDAERIQLTFAAPNGLPLPLVFDLAGLDLQRIQQTVTDARRLWAMANRNGFDRTHACVRGQGDREEIR
jgi:hypothetical protein